MKKFITRSLPLLFIFLLFSKNIKGQLLWEISGNGLTESSYLYGTIHIPDKRAFEFNDSVFAKIEACEVFALEIQMNDENQKLMEKSFILDEGKTLSQFYSKEDYEFMTTFCKEELQIDIEAFKSYKPLAAAVAIMYMQMNNDMGTSVDDYLNDFAKSKNKKTIGLEPIETQTKIFKDLPPEYLLSYLKNFEANNLIYDEMVKAYRKEDVEKLFEIIEIDTSFMNYQIDILWNRNISMADSIAVLVQNSSSFMAIGAAHLPRKGGVIDLLENKGYQLTPIVAPKSKTKFDKENSFDNWVNVDNEKGGFTVRMPQEPEYKKQEQPSELGVLEMNMIISEGKNNSDKNLYLVSFTDYPLDQLTKDRMSESELEAFYTNAINGGAKAVKGKVVKTDDMMLDTFKAKTADIEAYGGMMKIRFATLLIKNRMYFLQVLSQSSLSNNSGLEYFFKSFKITDEVWTTPTEPRKIPEWELFESKEGRYAVEMFGNPVMSTEQIESEVGDIVLTFQTSEVFDKDGNDIANSVLHVDYPLGIANSDSMSTERLSEFYSNTVSSALENQVAELLFEKEVLLSGKPSLRYKGRTQEDGKELFINAALILVKNRMYMLQYITSKNESDIEANKFFNSFKLLTEKDE